MIAQGAIMGVVLGGLLIVAVGQSRPPPPPAAAPVAVQIGDVAPVGQLASAPSLSAAQIDSILASYGSPATGSGADFYRLGIEYGIDPAYALAFFVHESTAGTNPAWAGIKPDGT